MLNKKAAALFEASIPKPWRPWMPLPALVVYFFLAVMVSLPLGAGAALVAQTPPTLQASRPDPRRQQTPRASERELGDLQRDFDTTIPALVDAVKRLEEQEARDNQTINDLRIEVKVTQGSTERLESYAAYMMATLSAVVIGMVLQIWQKLSERRNKS